MIPFIRYDDALAAIEWLRKAFGFEEKMVVPGDGGTIDHAELTLGRGLVMVGSMRGGRFGMKSARELDGTSRGVYVVVDDPDAHFERAEVAGAEIVAGLTDEDYGSRGYVARDLEGNLWSFGTYDPQADR
jgi:uncharacterized glyoxalase superfamily protein PhnB